MLHIDEEKKYMTFPKHDRDSKKPVKTDTKFKKKKKPKKNELCLCIRGHVTFSRTRHTGTDRTCFGFGVTKKKSEEEKNPRVLMPKLEPRNEHIHLFTHFFS